MNKQNKIYTAIDFANYHAGNMPAKDMHALEKAALEDDFLADALDGYVHNTNPTNDITFLQEKFANKKEDKKVFSLASFAKSKWMRIAAMFIVFVGLGYLFYNVNKTQNESTLAKAEPTKETTVSQDVKVDSNKTTTDAASANTTKGNNTNKETEKAPALLNAEKEDQVAITPAPVAAAPAIAPVQANENFVTFDKGKSDNDTKKVFEKADDKGYFNAQTQTTQNNNIQNQNVFLNANDSKISGPKQNVTFNKLNNNASNQVVNNNNPKFTIPVYDSTANGAIASNDLFKRKDNSGFIKSVPAKMEENKEVALNEVVITGYENAKRKKENVAVSTTKVASDALSAKVSGVQVEAAKPNNVTILRGRSSINADSVRTNFNTNEFNEYVKKYGKPEFNDKGIEIKGTVLLSFKTNKNGKPVKIKIVKSLCTSCDAQAIQLLKDGPTWGKNINDRQQVSIAF